MTLEEQFGTTWYKALEPVLKSPDLGIIARMITQERKAKVVFPESDNVFRAFRETPFSTVRVVWLGQDPYNDVPGQATGLAFDCGKYVSNSMKKIIEVYDKAYPMHFNTDVMEGKLLSWAHQGVFLLNASLTVVQNIPNSHASLWKGFTQKVIAQLVYDATPKVFVGLGKHAQALLGDIPAPHHLVTYEHPAAASYERRTWNAREIFAKINTLLEFSGHRKIDW